MDPFGDAAERETLFSGTASLQGFDEGGNSRYPAVKRRILDIKEDDCRATRVLPEGIRVTTCAPHVGAYS
jgi:hypothetical protein